MTWRIQLFGKLALAQGDRVITHFESDRAATLLAFLALHSSRPHPREELIERLWPDCDPERGRPRLRQTLYSLRGQLEPPGTPSGSVLIADRQTVALNPGAFTCDAVQFEQAMKKQRFHEAARLYTGELLPGYYDDWIITERQRLANMAEGLFPAFPTPTAAVSSMALPVAAPVPAHGIGEERTGRERLLRLPVYLTAFFGREHEKQAIAEQLADVRLLTLTGAGGIGKTRLAVETARAAGENFDTVAFVPLAECLAAAHIPDAIRAALQLPASPMSSLDQIATALAGRKMLLILDNFEQLVNEGGADVVETLLAELPSLTALVTSRRRLELSGEQEFCLSPLPVPEIEADGAEAAHNPSLALFLQRAQAARPGYRIHDSNRADLIALCRALEGVPLALELAAARIRVLSPAEMRAQIESRFQWLARSGPGADKQARHRSLTAALEWSWRLLKPSQQRFLAALSVFRGGWTVASAEQVCDAPDARERLESLIADSLAVSRETQDGTTRFEMLEMVRDWIKSRCDEAQHTDAKNRHVRWFTSFAETHGGQLGSADMRRSLALLSADYDNLRAALQWCLDAPQTESGLRLAVSLCRFWHISGRVQEGAEWLERFLDAADATPSVLRGKAAGWAGHLACLSGNTALAKARHQEGLEIRHAVQDQSGIAESLNGLGIVHFAEKNYAESLPLWEQSLALFQSLGDTRMTARLIFNLATGYDELNETQRSDTLFAESLAIWQTIGPSDGLQHCLDSLTSRAFEQGDQARGRNFWIETLHLSLALGYSRWLPGALEQLTVELTGSSQFAPAARLSGFAARQRDVMFPPLEPCELTGYAPALHQLQRELGDTAFTELQAQGMALSQDEIVAEAVYAARQFTPAAKAQKDLP